MPSKFFNKPQLGQTQLQQGEKTNLTGVDNAANTKAAQASKSIDMLAGIGNTALGVVGKYQKNIDAKRKLQSGKELPDYQAAVRVGMSKIQNLEELSSESMKSKIQEINEDFLEGYKSEPYSNQLRDDIDSLSAGIHNQMLVGRDELHVQKVSDATSGKASGLAQQYAAGTLDFHTMQASVETLLDDSMIAHQVPTSTELDISDEAREKYMNLTREQARDALLKGIMIQTGQPENSRVAELMSDKDFRKSIGVKSTDEDYNKLVSFAKKKGAKADKFKYSTDKASLEDSMYAATNIGLQVNVGKQIKEFRASGSKLTAKDEHKLRKEFEGENTIVATSAEYTSKLNEGVDITAKMTNKESQAIYNRSFTDTLGITSSGASIGNISGALSIPLNQEAFKSYIQSGGKIPKAVVKLFDVPAGAGVEKWDEANAAIMSMEASAAGSGQSIESLIGVNQVSKVRGLSKLLNDDNLDEATKKTAIEAFHTRSINFNSKGYLQGTPESRVDPDWINKVSTDAPWTTDDFVSDQQNADEIAGNYQAYRLSGLDESKSQELALALFKSSNNDFEMPDGREIVVPKEHEYLNNESILAFSKDAARFPSIQEQREDLEVLTGEGWISEWRANRNISIQKSYNFAKTGKYDMMFDGRLVKDSSFTYEEIEEFIAGTDYKTRNKITGVKNSGTFEEVEAEALSNRKENIKRKIDADDKITFLNDLAL